MLGPEVLKQHKVKSVWFLLGHPANYNQNCFPSNLQDQCLTFPLHACWVPVTSRTKQSNSEVRTHPRNPAIGISTWCSWWQRCLGIYNRYISLRETATICFWWIWAKGVSFSKTVSARAPSFVGGVFCFYWTSFCFLKEGSVRYVVKDK